MPADQLPAALHLAPAEWDAAYRCAKPEPDTWLVLQSRTCQRAAWAAQARARLGLHQECSEPGVQQGSKLVVQRTCGVKWSRGPCALLWCIYNWCALRLLTERMTPAQVALDAGFSRALVFRPVRHSFMKLDTAV